MSAQTPIFTDTAEACDVARPIVERQLELLGRLAEAGLNIALALERQATGKLEEGEAPVAADVSLAYARVSRAVRMTIALQTECIGHLQAVEAADGRPPPDYIRKARVERIVERVIKTEHKGADAEALEQTLDRLVIEAGERLDDEDLYGDILARPMSEVLAQICQDLGLSPDWANLAQEPWARAEIESGVVGWPFSPFPFDGGRAGDGGDLSAAPPLNRHPLSRPLPHQGGEEFEHNLSPPFHGSS